MDNLILIKDRIQKSIETKQLILANEDLLNTLKLVSDAFVKSFKSEGKVLFCGNGGSAADAQHIAAELSGRFYTDREPLFSEALHVNSSYLTAVANDYSFDVVYSRLVKAMGRNGDVLVGISTSGNSTNVIKALEQANSLGMVTVGFSGEKVGKMDSLCRYMIKVPSSDTPRIQESHILIGHILCEIVERSLFATK